MLTNGTVVWFFYVSFQCCKCMKYEIISDDILVDSRSTVDYNTFKRASDRLSHDMVTSDVDRIRSDYIVRQTILVALLEV